MIIWVGRNTAAGASGQTHGKSAEHVEGHARGRTTGIGRKSHEPIGQALGELMKGLAFSASMAADLALVEDQGQGISQKPNHGQDHQGRSLVDGGVFEVTIGGVGLKDFSFDLPTAADELMNEQMTL